MVTASATFLPIKAAARLSGVSAHELRSLIDSGLLTVYRVSGSKGAHVATEDVEAAKTQHSLRR